MLELIMLSQRVTVAHHCLNVFRQPGSLECLLSPHSQTFSARLSSPPQQPRNPPARQTSIPYWLDWQDPVGGDRPDLVK